MHSIAVSLISSGFYCSGYDLAGSVIGLAYLGSICGSLSACVNQDQHSSYTKLGTLIAHELGHTFGMSHDTGIVLFVVCSCIKS